jgi:hypothetical protein
LDLLEAEKVAKNVSVDSSGACTRTPGLKALRDRQTRTGILRDGRRGCVLEGFTDSSWRPVGRNQAETVRRNGTQVATARIPVR